MIGGPNFSALGVAAALSFVGAMSATLLRGKSSMTLRQKTITQAPETGEYGVYRVPEHSPMP